MGGGRDASCGMAFQIIFSATCKDAAVGGTSLSARVGLQNSFHLQIGLILGSQFQGPIDGRQRFSIFSLMPVCQCQRVVGLGILGLNLRPFRKGIGGSSVILILQRGLSSFPQQ